MSKLLYSSMLSGFVIGSGYGYASNIPMGVIVDEVSSVVEKTGKFSRLDNARQKDLLLKERLGDRYLFGNDGFRKDYEKAVELFQELAAAGSARGQTQLGYCYREGLGVPKDQGMAVYWYQLAAEGGCASAQYKLGMCFEKEHGVDKNLKEALKWYKKAVDQDYEPAKKQMKILNTELHQKADDFYYGKNGEEVDYDQAFKLYQLAASSGEARSQCEVGYCYSFGKGVEQDAELAVYWYTLAADQGNPFARTNLGTCFQRGKGIPKNIPKAIELFRAAANQGHTTAQFKLGFLFESGEGVVKDRAEAAMWYGKAADQGCQESKKRLLSLFDK